MTYEYRKTLNALRERDESAKDAKLVRAISDARLCPGLAHRCDELAEPGDRYCAACRAEFDATPADQLILRHREEAA